MARRVSFQWKKRINLGPLFVWLTPRGFTSWGWKLGRWTRNVTRDTHNIDTPGPGGLRFGRRRRRSS
jgi:hypothetical protein